MASSSVLRASMQIRVRGLDGRVVEATVEPDFTVHDVKELLCHGWCRHAGGSVSEALGVPPPHVKLMLGNREFDDASSLECSKIRAGMMLDLFPCYLSATQVYVQKDWERVGSNSEPRFIAQPWTCQNGSTAWHLKEWLTEVCGIEKDVDVAVEYTDGVLIDDHFSDWTVRPRHSSSGGIVLTAFKYADAIEPCPDSEAPSSSTVAEVAESKRQAVERTDYAPVSQLKKTTASSQQSSVRHVKRGGA